MTRLRNNPTNKPTINLIKTTSLTCHSLLMCRVVGDWKKLRF